MPAAADHVVRPLALAGFARYLAYLQDHVADNGQPGTGYFQPLARGTALTDEFVASFRDGLAIDVGAPGWRRAWIAEDERGEISGHVDLRAPREPQALHRCVLGMGVHRDARGRGLGRRLLDHACVFAQAQPGLAWMDLMVLADNAHAVRLYRSAGFEQTGHTTDHFRVDGHPLDTIGMTLPLKPRSVDKP